MNVDERWNGGKEFKAPTIVRDLIILLCFVGIPVLMIEFYLSSKNPSFRTCNYSGECFNCVKETK